MFTSTVAPNCKNSRITQPNFWPLYLVGEATGEVDFCPLNIMCFDIYFPIVDCGTYPLTELRGAWVGPQLQCEVQSRGGEPKNGHDAVAVGFYQSPVVYGDQLRAARKMRITDLFFHPVVGEQIAERGGAYDVGEYNREGCSSSASPLDKASTF